MKKRIIAIVACIALTASFALAGCGGNSNSSSPASSETKASTAAKEPVTIKFGVELVSDEMIAEFNKQNPDIQIEMVDAGQGEKLMAMLAAGTAPDLIRVSGVIDVPSYATKGIALNLDKYFAKSTVFKEDDLLPVCDVYKFDGKQSGAGPRYGLPKDWSQDTGLIVNKKVFQNSGVAVPSEDTPLTYTQLFELGKQLSKFDSKGKILQLGIDDGFAHESVVADYQTLLYQAAALGTSLFTDDMKASRFSDPQIKKLIEQWIEVKKAKITGSPVLDKTGMGGVVDDKIAIQNFGYWATGMYRGDDKTKNRLDTDFMLLPSPYPEGAKPSAACTGATGGIIYSETEHPEEAFKVFEWFFGGKPAEERAKGGWGLPVLKHLMSLVPQETAFDKQAYKIAMKDNEVLISIKHNPYLPNLNTTITKELTPVLFDKIDLDTALKNLDDTVNKMIKEGMEVAGIK